MLLIARRLPNPAANFPRGPLAFVVSGVEGMTSFSPMGSLTAMNTIGIVVIACCAATAEGVLTATKTSTLSAASSAARAPNRSGISLAKRCSSLIVRPSPRAIVGQREGVAAEHVDVLMPERRQAGHKQDTTARQVLAQGGLHGWS
jgi:hypothetical protein